MVLGFRNLKSEEAVRVLSDVSPEKCFWVHNGPVLHNIYELSDVVMKMGPETFSHHSNGMKNDFSNWIADVLRDSGLAGRLRKIHTREGTARAIRKRINELEKICRAA